MKRILISLLSFAFAITCLFAVGCRERSSQKREDAETEHILSYQEKTLALSDVFSCSLNEISAAHVFRSVLYSGMTYWQEEEIDEIISLLFPDGETDLNFYRVAEEETARDNYVGALLMGYSRIEFYREGETVQSANDQYVTQMQDLFVVFFSKDDKKVVLKKDDNYYEADTDDLTELYTKYAR